MRLLITRPLPKAIVDAASARFETVVRPETVPLGETELRSALRDFDLVLPTLRDAFNAQVFADVPQPRTKLLANFGVGYNHIDVAAARAAGVAVSNTPGAVTEATADIGLTLILMAARRASEGERLLRSGKWDGWHPTQLLGMHPGGKTVGIIGMGRIGKAVARRCALGLGMSVIFYNRSPVPDPGVPARQVSFEEALGADVVVVTLAATPETKRLIDAKALARMKPSAIFVNIARGDIVHEEALVDALQTGMIAGAGLDVYEFEPKITPALLTMDNVTLLPHLGTAALEVRTSMGLMAVDNLIAFAEGRPLPNAV
ncbi:D-glycerate dehydrogenase [Tabrizicola sp. J26]|uniref:2-hydroxyacid dehydrogenase n=1 Tax=Alitabrizicola rongguiensis TaxID=2909234 RepID=UPI001F199C27|nr:D-glycerate dehydrogenase [Tabrizicola rongguiensis]MCF1710441.1 D-glycerate dehydrogenase [Tabrizicola rongguiensis]